MLKYFFFFSSFTINFIFYFQYLYLVKRFQLLETNYSLLNTTANGAETLFFSINFLNNNIGFFCCTLIIIFLIVYVKNDFFVSIIKMDQYHYDNISILNDICKNTSNEKVEQLFSQLQSVLSFQQKIICDFDSSNASAFVLDSSAYQLTEQLFLIPML